MKRRIGWYDPQSCTFFNGDKDDGCHGTYSEPVFIDDDDGEIPMPPCKEPGSDGDDKSWREIQLQTLLNQHFIIQLLWDARLKITEFGPANRDASVYDALQKRTETLCDKGTGLVEQ